ncbi:MAG: cellulose biosynthesis protein BcsG [Nitrospirota bacterium]
MGLWNFYFLAKLYLYFRGYIRFNFILNLLFLGFLVLPVSKNISFYRHLKSAKIFLSFISAFLIMWYDSWIPPLLYSIRMLARTGLPSKEYIFSFIVNSVNIREIALLFAILAVCIFLLRRITLTPVVLIIMLIVPLLGLKQSKEGLDGHLEEFYKSEAGKVVSFRSPDADSRNFDIIMLHICSLAWDDLKAVGMENHQFFRQFDLMLTNFNSVSSYTNPSAIRLLRANCGQSKHEALYQNAPNECYLLESLRMQNYKTYSAIDNDAPEFRFVEDIMMYGFADPPIETEGIPILQYSFDNSPIYDDFALLKKWFDIREKSGASKAVLYLDITSLHGGAHWAEEKDWWKRDRPSHYKEFVEKLFENLQNFFELAASSGRNYIIVFVPEHGMALRGSSIQAPDLRDIPLPGITLVPVGIKLIGEGYPAMPNQQKLIEKPTSYLAISYMLSLFLEKPPFGSGRTLTENDLAQIPETGFVSENQEALIMKKDTEYFLLGKDKKWIKLSDAALE